MQHLETGVNFVLSFVAPSVEFSMTGGAGSSFGVALGVLLFHTLWYCLRILDVNTNLQLVLIGLILVLSVIMDIQRKKIEARKLV